jgi:hypothetical protein
MDAPKGSLIAYATAPGSIAADGEGRNGIYTKYLLKYLITPGLTVEQVLKKVRVEVLKETNNKQIPWESSSLTGIFHFNPVNSEVKPSIIEPQPTPKGIQQEGFGEKYEMLFWDSIKESNDAEAFKEYLKKFPNGVFAGLARMNIKKYSQQIEEKPTDKSNVERLKIKKDKPKLANIPKTATKPKISLRKTPSSIVSENRIRSMLASYGFFDKSLNPYGFFNNDFIDHNDGTITDKSTGLMWQKAGSSRMLPNLAAKSYIRQLNKDKFAGYSDWRLPTIEELASLLKKKNSGNLYIDPIFDKKHSRCWSADEYFTSAGSRYTETLIANFGIGKIKKATWFSKHGPSWQSWYVSMTENYVRAVRTVK